MGIDFCQGFRRGPGDVCRPFVTGDLLGLRKSLETAHLRSITFAAPIAPSSSFNFSVSTVVARMSIFAILNRLSFRPRAQSAPIVNGKNLEKNLAIMFCISGSRHEHAKYGGANKNQRHALAPICLTLRASGCCLPGLPCKTQRRVV